MGRKRKNVRETSPHMSGIKSKVSGTTFNIRGKTKGVLNQHIVYGQEWKEGIVAKPCMGSDKRTISGRTAYPDSKK